MVLDLPRFYRAANPSRPLRLVQDNDRQYYIDFSSVRGGDIVRELERTIALLSPDEATTQLFTGNIGCGKSTELLRLKAKLEQQGFHVVYFESDRDLEMADVDISDILLMIAHQVVESLENDGIRLKPSALVNLFRNLAETLQTPMEIADVSFSVGIAALTARAKESPEMRSRMRQYLEPRTKNIIDAINEELLEAAIATLRSQGKKGLVVIVDNLDRIDPVERANGRTQSEYLFIDRGEQLKRLNCHVVYTIPLALVFSDDLPRLSNRFGVSPKVLPMVPVAQRDGTISQPGLALLQQMVLARAFPNKNYNERIDHIGDVFETMEVLNRLCRLSGGHMRNLMRLLYGCLQKGDPPLQSTVLEAVIRDERDSLMALIDEGEWQMMFKAISTPDTQGNEAYGLLLRSLFLYEYRDHSGRWFDLNPVLKETNRFKHWLAEQ
ncbi:ATP-binding protein [Leptolyngbya cf. ectocarpi LEGE 11479]|uniref:ATP-binding protein n=1 Tax=Leptolyngbya cf. ectocarpi LEGE 11479 TaxID=1828722 RepID=A0A928ZSS5_LEPEC|nr:P-loop NTPase fold protein [Leptolyngbya ectocarpi]MBE9066747.1 ATP-binding protein [Leptolyngbya cf. ectocarpi LEGE 11479]